MNLSAEAAVCVQTLAPAEVRPLGISHAKEPPKDIAACAAYDRRLVGGSGTGELPA
jgi:hypothetical protein